MSENILMFAKNTKLCWPKQKIRWENGGRRVWRSQTLVSQSKKLLQLNENKTHRFLPLWERWYFLSYVTLLGFILDIATNWCETLVSTKSIKGSPECFACWGGHRNMTQLYLLTTYQALFHSHKLGPMLWIASLGPHFGGRPYCKR